MNTVAVEPALSNVREYLQSQGWNCVDASASTSNGQISAIVVNGSDKNLMGMQDVVQNVPVVNAEGMSPEQVAQRLQQYRQQ